MAGPLPGIPQTWLYPGLGEQRPHTVCLGSIRDATKEQGRGLDLTYIAGKENAQQRHPTRREGWRWTEHRQGQHDEEARVGRAELDAEEVSMATLNQEGSPLQSVTGL